MTYSPLITETMPPVRQGYGNKWSPRPSGVRIDGTVWSSAQTIHWIATL